MGETVRRPLGSNASFVHSLLAHLEEVGFEGVPSLLGIDDEGREVLTFIEGSVPSDCHAIVWSDQQLASAAKLLRGFHDATVGFAQAGQSEVVCHHDFGPWNLIWRNDVPVAIIDFDEAAPGSRIDDLGYAIWKHLNLGLIDLTPADQSRRMRIFSSAYDAAFGAEVLAAVEQAQARMERKIEAATPGAHRAEALARLHRERQWLETNKKQLLE